MLETSVLLYSIETRGDNPGTSGLGSAEKIARLAKETGGEVVKAGTAAQLANALDSALLNLKERYVLGFTPSNLGEPGSYHRLLVTFDTAERWGIPYSTTIPLKIPDQRIKVVAYDQGSVRLGSRLAQIK